MDFGPEQSVHGLTWGQQHGGYFSDPTVAQMMVQAVGAVWDQARPDVIVDLGGGTGFWLSQWRKSGLGKTARLVVLDASASQVAQARRTGLDCVQAEVGNFKRDEVVPRGMHVLFAMRSVLHYTGEFGWRELVNHIRSQTLPGEFWVHQTACFERQEDAACLNALYRKMHTGKWYPTVQKLHEGLIEANWNVVSIQSAPTLNLASEELGARYGLSPSDLKRIQREMVAEYGCDSPVFHAAATGFQAHLHYRIWCCQAVP